MKRKAKLIGYGVTVVLRAALLIGMAVLSDLGYRRGGVNHHLAYRKRQFNAVYFTPQNITLAQIAIWVLCLVFFLLYWRKARPLQGTFPRVLHIDFLLSTALFSATLSLTPFREMLIYPYLNFATLACYLISLILLVIFYLRRRKSDSLNEQSV